MALATAHSKAVILFLFIYSLLLLQLCVWVGGGAWSLFCSVVINFLSSFAIILLK